MLQPAIEIHGIEKTYPAAGGAPSARALRGVDLTVGRGAIFCVLGPNGAGKTTLISILCGLLYPDAGGGRVCGLDLLRQRRKIRDIVNFAGGHAHLPDNFTGEEILDYFGRLYGLARTERRRKADELMHVFEMEGYRKVPFNQLSTGLKQRLALAKSLVNDPKILFLDEPTVGLDPQVSLLVRSRLKQMSTQKGLTIFLTTHDMDEAEQLSDGIAFLRDGSFVRIGTAEELKKTIQFQERVTVQGSRFGAASDRLRQAPGITLLHVDERELTCEIDSREKRLQVLLEILLDAGAIIEGIEISKPSLGDVFVALAKESHSSKRILP
jgi:ABC-2 type transport system ATP-binding protein